MQIKLVLFLWRTLTDSEGNLLPRCSPAVGETFACFTRWVNHPMKTHSKVLLKREISANVIIRSFWIKCPIFYSCIYSNLFVLFKKCIFKMLLYLLENIIYYIFSQNVLKAKDTGLPVVCSEVNGVELILIFTLMGSSAQVYGENRSN